MALLPCTRNPDLCPRCSHTCTRGCRGPAWWYKSQNVSSKSQKCSAGGLQRQKAVWICYIKKNVRTVAALVCSFTPVAFNPSPLPALHGGREGHQAPASGALAHIRRTRSIYLRLIERWKQECWAEHTNENRLVHLHNGCPDCVLYLASCVPEINFGLFRANIFVLVNEG